MPSVRRLFFHRSSASAAPLLTQLSDRPEKAQTPVLGTWYQRTRVMTLAVLYLVLIVGCSVLRLSPFFSPSLDPCYELGGYQGAEPGAAHYKPLEPYEIRGVRYYPREDYGYDETGISSWYGPGFHGKQTANGEIYDQMALTAAHKTLPLPSCVRVTNLENGQSVVLRVNDRGPFHGERIIDVSQRAAQLLGFEEQGTARVRVQMLGDVSIAMKEYITG